MNTDDDFAKSLDMSKIFKHASPQEFSVSYPIIKYVIQNPQSSKAWKKLIKTCKYFYSKKPALPILCLNVISISKCSADEEIFNPYMNVPKLWVCYSLTTTIKSDLPSLIPKIYKFDLCDLYVENQNLSLADYQKLTSSCTVEKLCLTSCKIKNDDGTIVTLDTLLENLHRIERFEMNVNNNPFMFKPDTVMKVAEHLMAFKKLYRFKLSDVPETFDLSNFLVKNKSVEITLYYFAHISATSKEAIKNCMEKMKNNPSFAIPFICFN